jgi:hypothetical protein
MRLSMLALFLCAGTTALCQSGAQAPWSTDEPGQKLQPGSDFTKPPQRWNLTSDVPLKSFTLPKGLDNEATARLPQDGRIPDAQIDPKMILHPKSSLSLQGPGTLVAQNQYPNLQLLPIQSPASPVKTIPVEWPKLKLQSIPTQWPGLQSSPVQGGKLQTVQAPPH